MGDIVELRGPPAHPEADHEFVSDCCRYQEGIATEQVIKAKYRFADEVWDKLGDNEKLLEAIADEKTRRIRTGQQKRERSQHLITKAPAILDTIMSDPSASPRHRVDAIKTLDGFATPPAEVAAAAADRFQIVINLGSDLEGRPIIETYDKSISISADDAAPDKVISPKRSSGSMQLDLFTTTTPDKPWDSGSDEPV